MNIEFNRIVLDSVNENKLFYVSAGLGITGFVLMQILFPRMYGEFIANIPDSITNVSCVSIIAVLLPYLISEFLQYASDIINSRVTPKI